MPSALITLFLELSPLRMDMLFRDIDKRSEKKRISSLLARPSAGGDFIFTEISSPETITLFLLLRGKTLTSKTMWPDFWLIMIICKGS